MENFN